MSLPSVLPSIQNLKCREVEEGRHENVSPYSPVERVICGFAAGSFYSLGNGVTRQEIQHAVLIRPKPTQGFATALLQRLILG
jgi:hypothetical protein